MGGNKQQARKVSREKKDRLQYHPEFVDTFRGRSITGDLTFDSKPIGGFDAFSKTRGSELARDSGARTPFLEGTYACRPDVKKRIRDEWDKMPALHDIWKAISRHYNIILAANTPQDGRCVAFLASARPTAGFEAFVTHRILEFDGLGFKRKARMLEMVVSLHEFLGKATRTLGVQVMESSKHGKTWPFMNARFLEWWSLTCKERIGWLNLGLSLIAAKCGFNNQIAHGSLGWGLMSKAANGFAEAETEEEYREVQNATVAKLVLADYSMTREFGVVTPFAARALTWRLKQTKGNFTCVISSIINRLLDTAVDEHGTLVANNVEPWDRLVEDAASVVDHLHILPLETLTKRSSYRKNIDDYFVAISDNVLSNSQHPFHEVMLQICDAFKFVTDIGCVENTKAMAVQLPLIDLPRESDDEYDGGPDDDFSGDDTASDDSTWLVDNELRDECRVAADKFAQQRMEDASKIPNLPAPAPAPASSSSSCKPAPKPAPKPGPVTKLSSETSILSKLPERAIQDVKLRALENKLKRPLPPSDPLIALLEPGASEAAATTAMNSPDGSLHKLAASATTFVSKKTVGATEEANGEPPDESRVGTEQTQRSRAAGAVVVGRGQFLHEGTERPATFYLAGGPLPRKSAATLDTEAAAEAAAEARAHEAKKKKKKKKKKKCANGSSAGMFSAMDNCPPAWISEQFHSSTPELGTKMLRFVGYHEPKSTRSLWTIGTEWPATVDDIPPRIASFIHYDDAQKYDQDNHLQWKRLVAIINSAKKELGVTNWALAHSYTINLEGHPIVYKQPCRREHYLAYHSSLYSEVTLQDGRVDRLTMQLDDPNGCRIVDLHHVRIDQLLQVERLKARGRAWDALSPEEKEKSRSEHKAKMEEKAAAAAEELLRQEELEHQERESKAKKKEDARRLREREQAEKARLHREESECAAKALAAKQAEEKAAHAEEQRRVAAAKQETDRQQAEANFARCLAQKQAAEAAAMRAEAEAAAVAWAEATSRQAHEAKITATRAYASESRRVIEAQAEVMARYQPKPQTTSRPPPVQSAPPPAIAKAENDDDDELCVICMDADKTQVCVPCGHRCLCEACVATNKPDKCPVCRADVSVVIRVFG